MANEPRPHSHRMNQDHLSGNAGPIDPESLKETIKDYAKGERDGKKERGTDNTEKAKKIDTRNTLNRIKRWKDK